MSKVNQAIECFNNNFNCSQALLSTYSEEFGLEKETALKLSCGFGAGMGKLGHVCGAVTGAYLLIGLKYGQFLSGDVAAKDKTYVMVREFAKRFEQRNQSTICQELLGVDFFLDNQEVIANKVKEICPQMVKDAAEIIEEILF